MNTTHAVLAGLPVAAVAIPGPRPRLRSAIRAGEMGAVSQATYSQSSERTTGGQDGSFARMGSDFANGTY